MTRVVVAALLIVAAEMGSIAAQQADSASTERIRAALTAAQSVDVPLVKEPPVRSWGGITLVPPDPNSRQMVAVRVPVGEYAAKATHAVAASRRQRAERNARAQVAHELQEYLAGRP